MNGHYLINSISNLRATRAREIEHFDIRRCLSHSYVGAFRKTHPATIRPFRRSKRSSTNEWAVEAITVLGEEIATNYTFRGRFRLHSIKSSLINRRHYGTSISHEPNCQLELILVFFFFLKNCVLDFSEKEDARCGC